MNKLYVVILSLLTLFVAACSSQGTGAKPASAANPTPTAIAPGVKARVAPREFVELSMNASGVVAEVLVSEGDQVKAGQALVRLDDTRLKLTAQEARLKLKQAELDLEKAHKPADPADLAAAEKAIQAEQTALANATGARPTTIEQAQSALRSAELAVEVAQRDHNKLLDYKSWGYDVESQLRTGAVRLANLRADAEIARRNAAGAGARAYQSIAEAEQALAAARAKYERLKKQPEPENVQAAQLAVESARLALARAEANLKNAMLVAPIAGTVAEVKIKAGQQAANGAPLVTLADTSAWLVETDNLTELSVVQVQEGQPARVKLDAAPGLVLAGRVERIAVRSQDKRGEVAYTVRVALEQSDPRVRWGMTALVEFE